MAGYSRSIRDLIELLTQLPGIGPRTAERLSLYLVHHQPYARRLAQAIEQVARRVRRCAICNNFTETEEICEICRDPNRDRTRICVVEQPRDLVVIESSGAYRGLYHVLGGRISPLEGVEPDHLSLDHLVKRIHDQQPEEIILATSPTTEGDTTASYIVELLRDLPVQITRLARGLVPGSGLEIATADMLVNAIRDRRPVERPGR